MKYNFSSNILKHPLILQSFSLSKFFIDNYIINILNSKSNPTYSYQNLSWVKTFLSIVASGLAKLAYHQEL